MTHYSEMILKDESKTLISSQSNLYVSIMKIRKRGPAIISIQSIVATLGSLYYSTFGDPVKNRYYQEWFELYNGLTPCPMCRYARILMYPIVILALIEWKRKDASMYLPIMILSGLGIILEYYQYRFQMSNTVTDVKSVLCGVGSDASCAATDVMYRGWITIPLLCLVAFVVIFVVSAYAYRSHLSKYPQGA